MTSQRFRPEQRQKIFANLLPTVCQTLFWRSSPTVLIKGQNIKKTCVFDSVLNYSLKTVAYSTSVTVYDPCSGHIATHVDPLQATLKEIVYCDSQGHIRIN